METGPIALSNRQQGIDRTKPVHHIGRRSREYRRAPAVGLLSSAGLIAALPRPSERQRDVRAPEYDHPHRLLGMSQRLGSWTGGAPGVAEGKREVLEKFFQPPWTWEQESSQSLASSILGSSGHPPQPGRGPLIGGRGLGERLRFSAFLDEITLRLLSPAQLRALGWRGALDPLRYSPPQGRQRAKPPSRLLFPEDQLSEVQTQPHLPGPRGGSLDTGSTVEDGVGDPKFTLGQVWEELMTLKEQFLRLQEEMASMHRAHQVLEEKLQSLVSRLASSPPGPPVFFLLNEAPSCSPNSSMP